MMSLKHAFLMTVITVCYTDAARVLVMSMHGSSSHLGSMLPYISNLAKAGHSVTILETNGRTKARDFGYGIKTEHIFIPDDTEAKNARSEIWWRTSPTSNLVISIYYFVGDKSLQNFLTFDSDTFWRVANSSWDLIVVDELFTVHGYGIATLHKLNRQTPYIIFSPSLMFFSDYVINSLGRCSVCRPQMSLPSTKEVDYQPSLFAHRIGNALEHISEYIGLRYLIQWFGMPHLRAIGVPHFSWNEYFLQASAIFSDSMVQIGHPTPEGVEMTNVGSKCADVTGTLPRDVEDFMNDPASKGTIYAAFGSHVNWNTSPKFVKNAFIDAFSQLTEYRVIFAYNGPVQSVLSHVKIIDFAPQKEVLNHNSTKLFISHGGLKSMKESICAGVPMVLMPIFAEQAHNTLLARELGIAETLNKVNVTSEKITNQVKKVLGNEKYTGNIRRAKSLFLDRVIPAMDHSLFITEKILRHPHRQLYFKRKGINVSWTAHLYIDLVIVILSFVVVVYC